MPKAKELSAIEALRLVLGVQEDIEPDTEDDIDKEGDK